MIKKLNIYFSKFLKNINILIMFILCFLFIEILVPNYSIADMLQVGEELEYDVTYLSIKLGTIKIITLENDIYKGEKTYRSKIFIESNSNIPFLSLKAIFNSWMDTTFTTGIYFEGNSKLGSDEWGFQRITFNNPKQNFLKNEKYYNKEKINDTILSANSKILDGATLFFLARNYVQLNKRLKIPTIMDLSIGNTYLNFTGEVKKISIDAIKYPIKTYYFDGKADWVGIYGLGDKFEGWFSCDDARIPIKANMKVYIGNIIIELKKWKRNDWIPPKY